MGANKEHIQSIKVMKMVDLSIIIVNYNTFELTRDAVDSIISYSYDFTYEIIVVDNNSADNSLESLEKCFGKNDDVKFIKAQENRGFAAGNNLAIRQSNGRYVLLLNSDTVVLENTLNEIYGYMEEHRSVGALGCQVILENQELDKACKRSFPNVRNSFYRLFHIRTDSQQNNYNLDDKDNDGVYEVDCLTGAFMFIRREALQYLDETFFMYGEDIDLCYRIKNAGWKIVYFGKVKIIHYKGSSSKKQKSKLIYEFYRAMYIYYRKHQAQNYSFLTNFAVYLGIAVLCLAKLFINVFKKKEQ